MKTPRIALCLAAALAASLINVAAKPLKVYVMAGQSNMQGRARDHTLPHMMTHPDTAHMAAKMVDAKGQPRPIDDVWIAALGVKKDQTEKTGPLMMGYGYEYTRLLACLIRDLRKEFKAPAMPCIIGVMGIGGDLQRMEPTMAKWTREFRKAMAATADIPEFKGNVAAVRTEKFWEPKLEEIHLRYEDYKKLIDDLKREQIADMKEKPSLRNVQLDAAHEAILADRRKILYPGEDWNLMETGISNAAYHYLGSNKIYSRIGKSFADELIHIAK